MGATALAQLSVQRGGQVVLISTIKNAVFTIGRLPSCDLVLPDAAVSKNHAEIRGGADGTVITDLESETGTMVGDSPLLPHRPQPLTDGVVIRIGPYEIVYRLQIVAFDEPLQPSEPAMGESGTSVEVVAVVPEQVDESLLSPQALPRIVGREAITDRYLKYLPVTFHDDDFLSRFLGIFEAIWEPLENRQNHIAMYLSPRTCPVSWLPWLASWFDLDVPAYWPESRVRALLSEATDLYRWRGTVYGLTRMLEVCTGLKPEISESPAQPFVIRVVVRAPRNARPDLEDTLHALVQAHKAAHVGYVLEVMR